MVVKVDDQDAQLELDGKPLPHSGNEGRYEVAPGSHVLTVTAPGRETVRRDVVVKPGRTISVQITTTPAEKEPEPEEPTPE